MPHHLVRVLYPNAHVRAMSYDGKFVTAIMLQRLGLPCEAKVAARQLLSFNGKRPRTDLCTNLITSNK
jgi:hypothetical protein